MKVLRAIFTIPAAAMLVIVARLAKRWGIFIRFGVFTSERIGHLIGNTDIHLCEKAEGKHSWGKRTYDIWTHYGRPANTFAAKMIARVLTVWPQSIMMPAIVINKMFKGWQLHEILNYSFDRDPSNLMERHQPWFKFTDKEKQLGEWSLRQYGLPEGAKWVCLVVRDGKYLPHLPYHRFRDSDISTYVPAVEHFLERGYYVFRMGANQAQKLPLEHPRLIDYAFDPRRTDFMTIYLLAHCSICLSTSTGIDAAATAFRRPMAYVNFLPLEYLSTWIPSIAIWKHMYKDGRRMTPQEVFDSKAGMFLSADEFLFHKIEWQDNTPEEIKAVAVQIADVVEGKAVFPTWEEQSWFWKEFPNSVDPVAGELLHGRVKMRIGSEFLEEYRRYVEMKEAA